MRCRATHPYHTDIQPPALLPADSLCEWPNLPEVSKAKQDAFIQHVRYALFRGKPFDSDSAAGGLTVISPGSRGDCSRFPGYMRAPTYPTYPILFLSPTAHGVAVGLCNRLAQAGWKGAHRAGLQLPAAAGRRRWDSPGDMRDQRIFLIGPNWVRLCFMFFSQVPGSRKSKFKGCRFCRYPYSCVLYELVFGHVESRSKWEKPHMKFHISMCLERGVVVGVVYNLRILHGTL